MIWTQMASPPPGRVAADEIDSVVLRLHHEASGKSFKPGFIRFREGKRECGPSGIRPHRRHVGEIDGKRLFPEQKGIVPMKKMRPLDEHVGGNRNRPAGCDQGAVVANAQQCIR